MSGRTASWNCSLQMHLSKEAPRLTARRTCLPPAATGQRSLARGSTPPADLGHRSFARSPLLPRSVVGASRKLQSICRASESNDRDMGFFGLFGGKNDEEQQQQQAPGVVHVGAAGHEGVHATGPPPPSEPIPHADNGVKVTRPVCCEPGEMACPFTRGVYGPYLRFGGYNPETRIFKMTCLVVMHQGREGAAPTMKVRGSKGEREIPCEHLEHFANLNFWRFEIESECREEERKKEYIVEVPSEPVYEGYQARWLKFTVPPANKSWKWGFYSCNGFHDMGQLMEYRNIQSLWKDVVNCNEQDPIHIMVGGGDQLYNDPVLELPVVLEWLDKPSMDEKLHAPFSREMQSAVAWFYLHSYLQHWTEPVFSDAMATIPQIFTWDDHDVFDGWGSYTPHLQACPVFQGIFAEAARFFALFQHHSMPGRIRKQNGVFGESGWNQLVCCGPNTALMVLDARGERTKQQVVKQGSWEMIRNRIADLPQSIRHVVVVAPVPVVYPTVSAIESSANFLSGDSVASAAVLKLLTTTGLSTAVYGKFGVELQDDLCDHWSHEVHQHEKLFLVEMMQDLAKQRGFRFTLLSGDVHVAAAGRFQSYPDADPATDHRLMYQVVSSGIGNAPPPPAAAGALENSATDEMINSDTKQVFLRMFNNKVLCPVRNWCHVRPGGRDGSIIFQIRVEDPGPHEFRGETHDITVPVLEGAGGSRQARREGGGDNDGEGEGGRRRQGRRQGGQDDNDGNDDGEGEGRGRGRRKGKGDGDDDGDGDSDGPGRGRGRGRRGE